MPPKAAGTYPRAPSNSTGARPAGSQRAAEIVFMTKHMLIDAAHAEETRVAVVDGHRVEEFDFESRAKKQLRGNIYLAKVTRVEPSLQAAFIEYGGNRHGFLAFNEIHPDYYQIPVADRQAIMAEADTEDDIADAHAEDHDDDEGVSGEEAKLRRRLMRRYKIQEVIKRRQILLVQVVKEERGTKGAALTTYLSLAGRYCVLMPNTARGGGISRKITTATDRKRLKTIVQSLDVPPGMGLIVRTAGAKRTKQEIKRDYEYLLRLWENIRETTLKSSAPSLIYEEEDLVKRAIRDMFDKDIDEVIVDGDQGFRDAREFMRMLMPSQAKKVVAYRDPTPLFVKYKVEDFLSQIHSPTVPLKSGGYLVINQTEALVAVDVNSGRATKERNVEATALKTNMEAAEEAARQLRLRDLAGLIVIDFIDMDEGKNNRAVEKKLKDALAEDRARIQMGKISGFGLMEISRQRRRSGVLEGTTHVCEHCNGTGRMRSVESSALQALRGVELEAARGGAGAATLRVPSEVALYILNEKRPFLMRLHAGMGLFVTVLVDDTLARADHQIERTETGELVPVPEIDGPIRGGARHYAEPDTVEDDFDDSLEDEEEDKEEDDEGEDEDEDVSDTSARDRGRDEGERSEGDRGDGRGRGRRRRRRGGRRDEGPARDGAEARPASDDEDSDDDQGGEARAAGDEGEGGDWDGARRRRRRGRRGGRRMREDDRARDPYGWVRGRTPSLEDPYVWFDPIELASAPREDRGPRPEPRADQAPVAAREDREDNEARAERSGREEGGGRRRRGRGRGRDRGRDRDGGHRTDEGVTETTNEVAPPPVEAEVDTPPPGVEEAQPARRRVRTRKPAVEAAPEIPAEAVSEPEPQPEPEPEPAAAKRPSRRKTAAKAEVQVEAAPEPAPAPEPVVASAPEPTPDPVATEPDPAEILAPPVQPKRGWWRRG